MTGVELPSTREVAWHEAYHAASLIVSGMTPLAVSVDVWSGAPDGRIGNVKPDWHNHDFTPFTMREQLISVLLGAAADGEPQIDAACWPIDPEKWEPSHHADAEQAKFIAGEWLALDQVAWGQVVYKACERTKNKRFRRLVVEIARELEEQGELYQPELVAIDERTRDG